MNLVLIIIPPLELDERKRKTIHQSNKIGYWRDEYNNYENIE